MAEYSVTVSSPPSGFIVKLLNEPFSHLISVSASVVTTIVEV